jgi:hypothetical protein
MTRQDIEGTFLTFAGTDSFLLPISDIVGLIDVPDDAGQPPIRVLVPDHCMMMGAVLEPWRPLVAGPKGLWLWQLDLIERPADLPPFEWS